MFRQLLGSRVIGLSQTSRLRSIREYICLRESLNPQVFILFSYFFPPQVQAEQIRQFQEVSNKYQVPVQHIVEATGLVDLARLSRKEDKFFSFDVQVSLVFFLMQFTKEQIDYEINSKWQTSQFQYLGVNFDDTVNKLTMQYPELKQLAEPNSERKNAIKDLTEILFNDSGFEFDEMLESKNYVDFWRTEFKRRSAALVKRFEDQGVDSETLEQIHETLETIVNNYMERTQYYRGLFLTYNSIIEPESVEVQSKDWSLSELVTTKSQQVEKRMQELEQELKSTTKDHQFMEDIEEADFQECLNEAVNEEMLNGKSQNRYNEEGQKVIFNANVPKYNVLRYQVLAAVFGGTFLYLLYRGDARYKTILAVPVLAGGFFLMARQNQVGGKSLQYYPLKKARNKIPIVRQILLNQDRSYDFYIESNRVLSRLQNVQSSSIKLNKEEGIGHDLLIGNSFTDGHHLKVNGQSALLPFKYNGNELEFRRVVQQQY